MDVTDSRRKMHAISEVPSPPLCVAEACSEEAVDGWVYCSAKCRRVGRPDQRRTGVCCHCAGPFRYRIGQERAFCSKSCAATANNIQRGRKEVLCGHCGRATAWGARFCDLACHDAFRKALWLRGDLSARRKYGVSDWARRIVLSEAEHRCEAIDERTGQRCLEDRVHPVTGNTILQIDHKNGLWEDCRRENLRAVCPTCHVLTENYGSLNLGQGRTWKGKYKQFVPRLEVVEGDQPDCAGQSYPVGAIG